MVHTYIYKYLDEKYGAELAQASEGASDTIKNALLAKKELIEARFKSMIGEGGNTLAPAIKAIAFFYQSNDEFIMLLGSNIIETANEVGEDINHAREIYKYYVAIGSSRTPGSNEMDEREMFQQGVQRVNAGLSDAGRPTVDENTIRNVVAAAGAHNAAAHNDNAAHAAHAAHNDNAAHAAAVRNADNNPRASKRLRSDPPPTATQQPNTRAASEGGKRRIKRKHKKTHKKSHKKHHKRKTTRRKMIKVRKTKARKSKLHKKKSGKHTKKHRKH